MKRKSSRRNVLLTYDSDYSSSRRIVSGALRRISEIPDWNVTTLNFRNRGFQRSVRLLAERQPFDGVIMWNWWEKNVPQIPAKFEILKKLSPNQRRMFGCYLWDFGGEKPATAEPVKWQLDWYREQILAGDAEGVVLHTNTMADLDYPAYDAAIEWMNEHGDEEIPY